jgi:hypothetical protein
MASKDVRPSNVDLAVMRYRSTGCNDIRLCASVSCYTIQDVRQSLTNQRHPTRSRTDTSSKSKSNDTLSDQNNHLHPLPRLQFSSISTQIPTLAELRARAVSIPIPIPSMSSLSLNQSDPPTYSNSPPPVYKKKNWSFSPSPNHAQVPVQGTLPGERGLPAMKPSMGYLRDTKGVFGMSLVDILIV